MKIVAIVQARMGSMRFPNKVMRPICDEPMIGLLFKRLAQSCLITHIVLATSTHARNDTLATYIESEGYIAYRGDETDVLDRYYQAARACNADVIVRVTGDCPLIDAALVDKVIQAFQESGVDYASNTLVPTYPDGLDVEVFHFNALEAAWQQAKALDEREHVTPFIKCDKQFKQLNIAHTQNYSDGRWTVDEPEDFELIENIVKYFHPNRLFGWEEVLTLQDTHPAWFEVNQHLVRNEGAQLGQGQKLWKRAKRVIPGGNMLLSKRSEMFLPEKWPSYFSKTKGCYVWDMDGKQYLDMSIMGIGTNVLGYSHPEVDEAVRKVVSDGNLSTFNCPEEVYLAERLVALHPWADMVRLARTGGEANAMAIRIARAASGKDKVAICGYHGWHDWYLAANLNNGENLNQHLLPGLAPNGVPKELSGSILPFEYNDYDALEALVSEHEIGVIKMEVSRNFEPQNQFLQKVRRLATKHGIILIFDECTSGFRQTFGGLHQLYDVTPDMAVFGKTLGNGYAITAVLGRREIMDAAQTTFISSTFWTERIGPAAALKTLDVMEKEQSWEKITKTGRLIGERWIKLAAKYELPIRVTGLPAMIGFQLPVPDFLKYKTFITQEMLKKGILAANSVYACTAHTPDVIDLYFETLEDLFVLIKDCESGDAEIDNLLEGPVCHTGFKRLN